MTDMTDTRELKEDLRFYKKRYEQLVQAQARAQEEAEHRRQKRKAWREEEERQEMHAARDWPDAFFKARRRAKQEAEEERLYNEEHPDRHLDFFSGEEGFFAQVSAAETLYLDEMEEAEKRMGAIRTRARHRAAIRLLEAHPKAERLARALREDEPDYLLNW